MPTLRSFARSSRWRNCCRMSALPQTARGWHTGTPLSLSSPRGAEYCHKLQYPLNISMYLLSCLCVRASVCVGGFVCELCVCVQVVAKEPV